MTVIKILNQYGIIVLIAGVLASIICGALKLPIAKKIRQSCTANGLDNKVAADRIRNTCNAIVAALSAMFIMVWYGATEGAMALLSTKVYADILAAFTVAKLAYMLYEGAGEVSIKKVLHDIAQKIKARNLYQQTTTPQIVSPIDIVKDYLVGNAALPLTDSQIAELTELLHDVSQKN